jgi:sugar lactone lactonase YvrE
MASTTASRVWKAVLLLAVVAGLVVVPQSPATAAVVESPPGGLFYGVTPTRVLDTRAAAQSPCLQPEETRFVTVTRPSTVPFDAAAVVLNVTVVDATAAGFVTVFPVGENRPGTSSLNYRPGGVVANSATVRMGVNGQVAVFANTGCPNVLVDVVGFMSGGVNTPGGYTAVDPARRLDTRTGATRACGNGLLRNAVRNVVVGSGAVPSTATSVTLNVTVVSPSAPGFLTVFPTGAARPTASTINFAAGDVRANQTTVQVGTGGSISVFNFDGCVDVLVDVVGFTSTGTPSAGAFRPQAPTRLLDTRAPGAGGCIAPGTTRDLVVDPLFAVRLPPRMYSATVNVTVTGAVGDGFVTVFPSGGSRPGTSNVNFATGQTVANGAVVKVGALGKVSIFSNNGCPHVVVDAAGLTLLPPQLAVVTTVAGHGALRDGAVSSSLVPDARLGLTGGVVADPAGNVYFSDVTAHVVRKVSTSARVTTLAGTTGEPSSSDGTGARAGLVNPAGLARDSSGNLYVPSENAIRKISATGTVSTMAGGVFPGRGNGASAQFKSPSDVAVDSAGNVYVADTSNSQIRKITPAGVTSLLAGSPDGVPGNVDGPATTARFSFPTGVAVDAAGTVFVADPMNGKIRSVSPSGQVATVAGCPPTFTGSGVVPTGSCFFIGPTDVAVMANGHLAVVDPGRGQVVEFTPGSPGSAVVRAGVFQQPGFVNGAGSIAKFDRLAGITVLPDSSLVVGGQRALRKIGPATAATPNLVTTLAGAGSSIGVGGVGNAMRFNMPSDVAPVSGSEVLVLDGGSSTIRRVRGGLLNDRFAGQADVPGSADGPALTATLSGFGAMTRDSAGAVYLADPVGCTVRKITGGSVTTLAGSSGVCAFANGTGSAARFNRPSGVTVDSAGNLFVADTDNHRIRKVTPAGVVSTVAGSGVAGAADSATASRATLSSPTGIAVDESGNVYFSDAGGLTIRRVSAAGGVTTIAGNPTLPSALENGTGAAARFIVPGDMVLSGGFLYVVDGEGAVRKVSTSGVVTTLAGGFGAGVGVDGSGGSARFVSLVGIGADPDGNLFLVEGLDYSDAINTLRKVTFLP